MASGSIQAAVRASFEWMKRNGSAVLTDTHGHSVEVLSVEPQVSEGSLRAGRNRTVRRSVVEALKEQIPTRPEPGDRCSLDGWNCQVDEAGVEEEPFTWRITLRSRS